MKANSPIRGYARAPNADTYASYFQRRHNCDVIFVNEFRTTMMCSLCHKVLDPPNRQPKMRYRTCPNCTQRSTACQPASKIKSIVGRRKMQKLHKQRELQQQQWHPMSRPMPRISKYITYGKMQPDGCGPVNWRDNPERERNVVVWNRDVNAGRNILYRGNSIKFISNNLHFFQNHFKICYFF